MQMMQRCPATRATRPARAAAQVVHARLQQALPQKPSAMQRVAQGAAVALTSFSLLAAPVWADLNQYEYAAGGEFGVGSAQQFGEADVEGKDLSSQDLRRSNFTSASCKKTDFHGSNLQGAYFMKAVLYKANMADTNLSDTLMDRAVIVEADLTNAVLQRAVLTRSDLRDAKITGADFTNALVDRSQQLALCRYADGVNPVTGVSTRKSLGCGSARKYRASSPSNPEGPQVSEDEKEAFRSTLPTYRQ